jgi:methylmalonyl-CoA/ethylmalonyl-CoA epimerase
MLEGLRFHHIGIACFSIEESKLFYEQMGYQASLPIEDSIQDIRICFLEKDGMPTLELLAPVDDKSPVNRILEAQGVTPYHICYETDDLDKTIAKLQKEQKFVRVSKPSPACAIENRRVAFMYRKDIGLIEFVEK